MLLVLVIAIGVAGQSAVADEPRSGSPLPITLEPGPSRRVEVREGDHLWSISEDTLETMLGSSVPDDVVSPYWRQVVEVNAPLLRSGDPDLIFPGETVVLPPSG